MGAPTEIPYGEFLPDLPDFENPGALLAKNCIPKATSYSELRNVNPTTNALTTKPLGSFWARSSGDIVNAFAGDTAKLYKLNNPTTWGDVSRPATAYSASFWDFAQFGDRILATDGGATAVQYYDMGTSVTFDNLPGTPPRARVLAVVRNFVVLGNIVGDPTFKQNAVAWSGFNNTQIWTPSLSTQSNILQLGGNGGAVRRIIGGNIGFIFQERSIQSMTYVGPPTVFRIDEFVTDHGTYAPRSVCSSKDFIFYLSADGFYKVDRKTLQITPISKNKISRWFVSQIASSEVINVLGVVGRSQTLVYWLFRASSSSPTYDRMLIFDWQNERWSYAEISLAFIGEFASAGANLDTLDAIFGGTGTGGIDVHSIPVDTNAFSGGVSDLVAFGPTFAAGALDGTPLVAEIDTSEFAVSGQRTYIPHVYPLIETTTGTVEVASLTRDLLTASPVLGTYRAQRPTGKANCRNDARFVRYRTRITGGFTHAKGVQVEPKSRGMR